MGASVSAANERARAQQREAQAKMEAELSNLNEILLNRQHLYLSQLINNKGEDKTIPVKTFLEVKKHLSVDVSSGPSKNLTDTLENLFGGHFLASLKAFALGAVNAVLGSAESGSKEEHGYKVLLLFNTVVRVDYYVYGYKMFSTGITDEKRNGIVMVCTVGVVDMKSVGLETLVYLLGQQAATSMTFLDDQKAMWQARKQQLEIYSKKPRDLNQWTEFEKAQVLTWSRDMTNELLDQTGIVGSKLVVDVTDKATLDAEKNEADALEKAQNDAKGKTPPEPVPTAIPRAQIMTNLLSDIDKLIVSYDKLNQQVSNEQERMFETMTSVYKKAKGVVEVLKGL